MIKLLANEFVKNIKIMFRNWTSLSLLVIAPLILILLIGYTFSSENVSGINIGVVSSTPVDLKPLVYNVSAYADIQEFENIEDCLTEMALQNMHLCIILEGDLFAEANLSNALENLTSRKVVYYYDNTRKRISLAIIQNMQSFFGLKAEEISIESAESVIENIQALIVFINDKKQMMYDLKNESLAVRAELVDRKAKLEETRAEFLPSYYAVKVLQARLHRYSDAYYNATSGLSNASAGVQDAIDNLRDASGKFQLLNQSELTLLLNELDGELKDFDGLINNTSTELNRTVQAVDTTVEKLDNIKLLLDEEIERTDKYITKIDQSTVRMDATISELDQKLEKLVILRPELARKLIKPILYDFQVLKKDMTNIQSSFPQLLVIIIMFIALLFSNVSTLTEIHNQAHLRNLIAPVDNILYILGMVFTNTVIIQFQVFVLFAVSMTKLGITILPVFGKLTLISLMLIVLFCLVGMIFAYLFKTVQSSILMTTFCGLILFIFSNAMAPLESMPQYARIISSLNPVVIGEYILKQVQVFDTPFTYLLDKISLLAIYIALLLVAVILLAKLKDRSRD